MGVDLLSTFQPLVHFSNHKTFVLPSDASIYLALLNVVVLIEPVPVPVPLPLPLDALARTPWLPNLLLPRPHVLDERDPRPRLGSGSFPGTILFPTVQFMTKLQTTAKFSQTIDSSDNAR